MSRSPSSARDAGGKPPAAEYVQAAESAGLRYVTDAQPGIRRKRAGASFYYVGANGQRIRNAKKLERIRALAIPPAWTDVWICPLATGHIQATARDAKGRKQYRYHPRYRRIRDETKFDRMVEFSRVLPRIRHRVERDVARRGLPRDKVLATVVWLLEKTVIRVGNEEYAKENQSYGLTTMRREHVEVAGARLRFTFRGKSGIEHSVSITDRRIAKIVQRCQTLPGEELFQYVDDDGASQTVDSGDINDYLRRITGRDFTAKDFRTWAGTMDAAMALRDLGPARNVREAKTKIVRAIDEVAKRLGNTRAVCRRYYVHPHLLEAFRRGKLLPAPPPNPAKRKRRPSLELRGVEREVLQMLHIDGAAGRNARRVR